jgi:hypothetical protein
MESLLQQLLDALERIGKRHEDLYDEEARRRMLEAIRASFIEPQPGYQMPDRYGLSDAGANGQVRGALVRYVEGASARARELGLDTAQARLAAFQNRDVHSRDAEQYSDDFFGWLEPSELAAEHSHQQQ